MRYHLPVALVALAFHSTLLADDDAEAKKARLAEMKAMAGQITMEVRGTDGSVDAKMIAAPVLRTIDSAKLNKRAEDGSLWIWTHHGLPVAIVELFAAGQSHRWGHAMILTSSEEVTATRGQKVWRPQGEFKFNSIPGAGMPSMKAAVRRIQSRRLARRFSAHIVDGNDRQPFRLLPEPVYRYDGESGEDGAIYAFVRGETNPEALVLIQARNEKWECAAVRCSANEIHVDLDSKDYWMAEKAVNWSGTSADPFWVFYEDSGE
jgi:hypothetical protein